MSKKSSVISAVVMALAVTLVVSPTAGAAVDPSIAVYEGRTIDLRESWEGARACAVMPSLTECYDSEAAMSAAHPEFGGSKSSDGLRAMLTDCSSSLRLYDGTSYSGSVLLLSTRGLVQNLSTYGFDNRTSSYKMGACSGSFFSGANAGGSVYPGSTAANASSTSMAAGWNNVVSSIYIN